MTTPAHASSVATEASPAPGTLTVGQALTAATAVLDAHANGTPQEQADAVRSWWLGRTSSDGRPPCAFAVLTLVLPPDAFAIAFQAHFDAATTPPAPAP